MNRTIFLILLLLIGCGKDKKPPVTLSLETLSTIEAKNEDLFVTAHLIKDVGSQKLKVMLTIKTKEKGEKDLRLQSKFNVVRHKGCGGQLDDDWTPDRDFLYDRYVRYSPLSDEHHFEDPYPVNAKNCYRYRVYFQLLEDSTELSDPEIKPTGYKYVLTEQLWLKLEVE